MTYICITNHVNEVPLIFLLFLCLLLQGVSAKKSKKGKLFFLPYSSYKQVIKGKGKPIRSLYRLRGLGNILLCANDSILGYQLGSTITEVCAQQRYSCYCKIMSHESKAKATFEKQTLAFIKNQRISPRELRAKYKS